MTPGQTALVAPSPEEGPRGQATARGAYRCEAGAYAHVGFRIVEGSR
jgi:hypothetical protein